MTITLTWVAGFLIVTYLILILAKMRRKHSLTRITSKWER
jgi:hypothetical protein